MDRIRDLIASLDARGFESPYLERLRRRASRSARGNDALDALRAEILAEMAASLGRAEDRINQALLACDVLDHELAELEAQAPPNARAIADKIAEFNRQREQAERRVWELTVQREALGLRRHAELSELYPIPAKKAPR